MFQDLKQFIILVGIVGFGKEIRDKNFSYQREFIDMVVMQVYRYLFVKLEVNVQF